MSEYNYAHNNTQCGERKTRTAQFNKYKCTDSHISQQIEKLRIYANEREIPTACDETLNFICNLARIKNAKNILELGTGIGISGICLLDSCPDASLTTVEKNETFFYEARENFGWANMEGRVVQISGDAGEEIEYLPEESFDFIFMDSAKVQYVKYLPTLKKLLKKGGVLAADDVLLYGWITGEEQPPKKRAALIRHIQEYIDAAISDDELSTTIVDIGDGIALSIKKLP
ncbi:MAG: O-methyltransferase [Clostridia bacterium]|nr:O-methyltransferase [Clostridia bacterium]